MREFQSVADKRDRERLLAERQKEAEAGAEALPAEIAERLRPAS